MPTALGLLDVARCCGATIFHSFGGSKTVDTNIEFSRDEIIEWLNKNEKHQREALGNAVALVFLNDAQMSEFGSVFRERGYTFSDPMWHPKHRSRLYLGYIPLHKDPGTDVVPMYHENDGDYGMSDRSIRRHAYETLNPEGTNGYRAV